MKYLYICGLLVGWIKQFEDVALGSWNLWSLLVGISLHCSDVLCRKTGWILMNAIKASLLNNLLSLVLCQHPAFSQWLSPETGTYTCLMGGWGVGWHAVLRNRLKRFPSPSPFPSLSVFSVCYSIHPPDSRSLTLLFSQSGAQSFVHLFILSCPTLQSLCFSLLSTALFPFLSLVLSLNPSHLSSCCLLSLLCGLSLNFSSSVQSFCSSLSLSLSINSSLVGWRC